MESDRAANDEIGATRKMTSDTIHRHRRKSNKNKGVLESHKDKPVVERLDHYSPTFLETTNMNVNHNGLPRLGTNRAVSSARRKRREKHKQEWASNSSKTLISTVLGDLVDEIHSPTKASNPNFNDENTLSADLEISLAPPKLKDISYKLYVEQRSKKKFLSRDLNELSDEEYENITRYNCTPVNVAIAVQRSFRPLANLCCGILGGISLGQCLIMLYWSYPYQESLMKHFSECGRAFQSLFYFFSIITFISVLDSCDCSDVGENHFLNAFPFRPAPTIVAMTVTASFIVSLICAPLDDKLALAINNNASFDYNISSISVDWDIEWWVAGNYARCITAVVTWVLFSLWLGPDALRNHLIGLLAITKSNDATERGKSLKKYPSHAS